MFENLFIRLPLSVLQAIEVCRVWLPVITGFEMREIALDIAGCAATSRGTETNVRRHCIGSYVHRSRKQVVASRSGGRLKVGDDRKVIKGGVALAWQNFKFAPR
jgi:hypothetical protein